MTEAEMRMKTKFEDWLGKVALQMQGKNKGEPYSDRTVYDYPYGLILKRNDGTSFAKLSKIIRRQTGGKSFYSIETIEQYYLIKNEIQKEAEDLRKKNKRTNIGTKIKRYKEFLEYKAIQKEFEAWLLRNFSNKDTRNRYFDELLLNTKERKLNTKDAQSRRECYEMIVEVINARNVYNGIQTIKQYKEKEEKLEKTFDLIKVKREKDGFQADKLNLYPALTKHYKKFLEEKGQNLEKRVQELNNPDILAEEISPEETENLSEGKKKTITVNAYERNPKLRKKCIEAHGYQCMVCKFKFEDKYGELGKEYIHVHHRKPLSESGEIHEVDPVEDLAPVCPNCHAMLHRKKETLSIEELREIIQKMRGLPT